MFRSILVPLDGSQFAEGSLPLALNIANHAGARLELLRAHELYALHDPHACWLPYSPSEDAEFKEQEQAYLDSIVKRLRKAATVPVNFALVQGLVEDAFVERARNKHADLIVMAIHGRGPLSCFFLGSVAEELVRHGPSPLLLVRPQEAPHELGQKADFKRLLIPLDGSELAERVLEPAIELGSLMDSQYILTCGVEPTALLDGFAVMAESRVIDQGCAARRAVAQAYLQQVAERMRAKGLRVQTQVAVGESTAAAVLDVAREQNVDLIAVATHGRGGLTRFLMGSVADKVVRHSPVPVLVYRPIDRGKKS